MMFVRQRHAPRYDGTLPIALITPLLVLMLAAWPQAAGAQEPTPSPDEQTASVKTGQLPSAEGVQVHLSAPPGSITVGDPLTLELDVIHPAALQVLIPELEQSWGDFEVRRQSPSGIQANADGSATTHQSIEVTLFAPGVYRTPPLALTVSDAAGNLSQTTVPPAMVEVASILTEGDASLRDIKPQATLPLPDLKPGLAAGVLLLITVLAVAAWWIIRHRSGRLFGDNRSPEQIAHDELERIARARLPSFGQFGEHYDQVTDTLRIYLCHQYGLPAMDRTTQELGDLLQAAPLNDDHRRTLMHLFTEADLVKFAKVQPDMDAAVRLIPEAEQLVEVTAAEVAAARARAEESTTPASTAPMGA